jgi:hypothetical protein
MISAFLSDPGPLCRQFAARHMRAIVLPEHFWRSGCWVHSCYELSKAEATWSLETRDSGAALEYKCFG